MWYVRDVLYAVLYVRVSCFVVVRLSVHVHFNTSATLAQWGERSLSERTAQVQFPVRPDKTYTVFC